MKEFDVLVCGAGIAGLYCAQRTLENAARAGKPLKVGIIESADRIGGRIQTRRFPSFPDIPLELGAMRYLDGHQRVSALVAKYSLRTRPFSDGGQRGYFLRGESCATVNNVFQQTKYALAGDEAGKTPCELLEYAIAKVIPRDLWRGLVSETCEQANHKLLNWMRGKHRKLGFRDFLLSVVSEEAFRLIKDGSGYDSSFENWNILEAVRHIIKDFIACPRSFALEDGFDALSKALATDIRFLGGEFVLNSSVEGFDVSKNDNGASITCRIADRHKTLSKLSAKKLILALPQKNLLDIARNTPLLARPNVTELLHSVTPQPAVKVFFSYDEAWWSNLPRQAEAVTTDSPLRNIYYRLGGGEASHRSGGVLLAAYADMDKFHYWDTLLGEDGREESCAPHHMQEAIKKMLSEVHGVDVPHPSATKVIRWSPKRAGAAFHAWNPGVDCASVMEKLANPVKGFPVYVCGEAYSKYQCWIEGALSSAEFMLDRYFQSSPAEPVHVDLLPVTFSSASAF